MATLTERFHATAVRMLNKAIPTPNAKWIQISDGTVADPNEPWKVEQGTIVEHDVRILFFPRNIRNNELFMYLRETEIPTGVVFGIMYQDDAFVPDLTDTVKWEGKERAVTYIDPVQPVDKAIVYLLELRD